MENEKELKNKIPIMRAKITNSAGGEDFDFECVAAPFENGQVNYSWDNDEYYIQVIDPSSNATRTARMESGLPLFDNHPWVKNATEVLGISRSYEFSDEGIRLKVKLGARADEALRSDIKTGIVKTVSIEGDIYSYEIIRENGKLPVYRVTDWEPTSVSLAPVPQDIKSQIEVKRAIQKQISGEKPENDSFFSQLIKKF